MKKLILLLMIIAGSVWADRLCIVHKWGWADYTQNSEGTLDDTAVTWWTEAVDGTRSVEGAHACHNGADYAPPTDTSTGGKCSCRRTKINGKPDVGPWVYVADPGRDYCIGTLPSNMGCAELCGRLFMSGNNNIRSAILAVQAL